MYVTLYPYNVATSAPMDFCAVMMTFCAVVVSMFPVATADELLLAL
jgi:hypothetical protein